MSKQSSRQSGKSNANTKQRRESDVQAQRQLAKQARRQEQREEQRRQEQQRLLASRKRRTAIIAAVAVAAVVVIGLVGYAVYRNMQAKSPVTTTAAVPTATPINSLYPPVNGIPCDLGMDSSVHFHAQLSIYINGKRWTVPANIGIATNGATCLYWTHTHTSDGVIHIEAPSSSRTYTLGDFLDVWGTKFPDYNFSTRLDDANGWTVYVDGQPYSGDFHKIVLHEHTMITLAYNSPGVKPATSFNWGNL